MKSFKVSGMSKSHQTNQRFHCDLCPKYYTTRCACYRHGRASHEEEVRKGKYTMTFKSPESEVRKGMVLKSESS